MRRDSVPDADMPSNRALPQADVPAFPAEALDALLAGDLPTDEATAGLQPVVALLAALTAAPENGELAGQARALATFRRRGGMPAHPRRSARWRPRLLTSLLTVKAAAAAIALGGVAVAAYAGVLPAPAQHFAHNVIGAPSPKTSHSPASPQATPSGPNAAGPAAFGLCTAYAHAKAHGTATQKAVAFRNLAAAAGGAANIAGYCAAVPHPGKPTSAPSGKGASHSSGKPTSHPTGPPSSLPTPHAPGKPSGVPTAHSGKPSTVPTSSTRRPPAG